MMIVVMKQSIQVFMAVEFKIEDVANNKNAREVLMAGCWMLGIVRPRKRRHSNFSSATHTKIISRVPNLKHVKIHTSHRQIPSQIWIRYQLSGQRENSNIKGLRVRCLKGSGASNLEASAICRGRDRERDAKV